MLLDTLMQSPIAWAVLALIAVFSLGFGVFSFIKSRKKLEISSYYHDNTIVSNGKSFIPELKLLFHGEAVNNITVTRFAFWNSGNEVLNHSDIVGSKPLCILSKNENVEILDATLIKLSDETNKFRIINKSRECIKFDFDYMNKRDGAIVQIVHTGGEFSLGFDCKIKGGKEPKNLNKREEKNSRMQKPTAKRKIARLLVLMLVIVLLLLTLLFFLLTVPDAALKDAVIKSNSDLTDKAMLTNSFISLTSGYVLGFAIMFWLTAIKVLHINIPKSLRSDIEFNYE